MVTAVWEILWPINAFWNINRSAHTSTHQMATPPPSLLFFFLYVRVPVATGQNRSHLNGAFLVHRWALSPPLHRLFFIDVSLTANGSRSACAGLLLQDRWDSVKMRFSGWPTWCNHNAARLAFFLSFWWARRERWTQAGAHSSTHAYIKPRVHMGDIARELWNRSSPRILFWPLSWAVNEEGLVMSCSCALPSFLPSHASRWQYCHINLSP